MIRLFHFNPPAPEVLSWFKESKIEDGTLNSWKTCRVNSQILWYLQNVKWFTGIQLCVSPWKQSQEVYFLISMNMISLSLSVIHFRPAMKILWLFQRTATTPHCGFYKLLCIVVDLGYYVVHKFLLLKFFGTLYLCPLMHPLAEVHQFQFTMPPVICIYQFELFISILHISFIYKYGSSCIVSHRTSTATIWI